MPPDDFPHGSTGLLAQPVRTAKKAVAEKRMTTRSHFPAEYIWQRVRLRSTGADPKAGFTIIITRGQQGPREQRDLEPVRFRPLSPINLRSLRCPWPDVKQATPPRVSVPTIAVSDAAPLAEVTPTTAHVGIVDPSGDVCRILGRGRSRRKYSQCPPRSILVGSRHGPLTSPDTGGWRTCPSTSPSRFCRGSGSSVPKGVEAPRVFQLGRVRLCANSGDSCQQRVDAPPESTTAECRGA
jgi:hypothetical protein